MIRGMKAHTIACVVVSAVFLCAAGSGAPGQQDQDSAASPRTDHAVDEPAAIDSAGMSEARTHPGDSTAAP
jgi:hypothetical protein